MNTSTLNFYHLRRASGEPLILYSFDPKHLKWKELDGASWQGWYGSEPRAETVTWLRGLLYKLSEEVLLRHTRDQRFLPRFLWGFATFLALYFLLAFVVRIPMHFVLRLVLPLAAGVGVFFGLRTREETAGEPARLRIVLHEHIDRAAMTPSAEVEAWEIRLQELEGLSETDQLKRLLLADPVTGNSPETDPLRLPFVRQLPDLQRFLAKVRTGDLNSQSLRLKAWLKNRKIDLPLLLLALQA